MSHFVRCDRCEKEDFVTGTLKLPPGWERVLGNDLCEPCMLIVRDFIKFKPSAADALPVEPIEQAAPAVAPTGDKLFAEEESTPNAEPDVPVPVCASVGVPVDAITGSSESVTPMADPAPPAECSAEERARTVKTRKRLKGQDAILPDPNTRPQDPPAPGVQP